MRNNASISTTAGVEGAGGNGGNIKIDSGFVLAFPLENSDITANAFEGNGGNIDIDAQGIFGIEKRQATEGNITNDIDASSEFGLSGTVEIDILEVDPSQDSLNVPVFVVIGRGGLPPEPEDNFRLPALATTENNLKSEPAAQQPEVAPQIIEATTWLRNEEGKIFLLASPSTASSLNTHSNSANCNS